MARQKDLEKLRGKGADSKRLDDPEFTVQKINEAQALETDAFSLLNHFNQFQNAFNEKAIELVDELDLEHHANRLSRELEPAPSEDMPFEKADNSDTGKLLQQLQDSLNKKEKPSLELLNKQLEILKQIMA